MKHLMVLCLLYFANAEENVTDIVSGLDSSADAAALLCAELNPAGRNFRGESPTTVRCVDQCKQTLQTALTNIDPKLKPATNPLNYPVDKIDNICRAHTELKNCLSPCSDGKSKTSLAKVTGLMKFACESPSFRRNAPCIKIASENAGACIAAPRCKGYSNQMTMDAQDPPRTPHGLSSMMRNNCLYTKCTCQCIKTEADNRCGHEAKRDIENVVTKYGESAKSMFELNGLEAFYPHECNL